MTPDSQKAQEGMKFKLPEHHPPKERRSGNGGHLFSNGFHYPYTVLSGDVDQFKHTSFANYVKIMFQAADSFFLMSLGQAKIHAGEIRLIHSELYFKRQTVTGDKLSVRVTWKGGNARRITLAFHYSMKPGEEIVAEGNQIYELNSESNAEINRNISQALNQIKDTNYDSTIPEYPRQSDLEIPPKVYTYDKIKIYFKHTDYFGHLHPYNYFEWTSHVREAFFSEKCHDFNQLLKSPIAMMTAKIELFLFEPCLFADEIEARLNVTRVKKVSFDIWIRFFNKRIGRVVSSTRHTLVFFDTRNMKFSEIPTTIHDQMMPFFVPDTWKA